MLSVLAAAAAAAAAPARTGWTRSRSPRPTPPPRPCGRPPGSCRSWPGPASSTPVGSASTWCWTRWPALVSGRASGALPAPGGRRVAAGRDRWSRTGDAGSADAGLRGHVPARRRRPDRRRRAARRLAALGDSVAVADDGDGTWNVHVHCTDVGAAIEAGIDVGRPHRITVIRFADQRRAARARAGFARTGRVLLVVAGRRAGRAGPRPRAPWCWSASRRHASTRTSCVRRWPAPARRHVVLLPDDAELAPVAERAAAAARRRRAGGAGHADGVGAAGAGRAGRARPGAPARATTSWPWPRPRPAPAPAALVVAEAEALTWVGRCEPGDVLGLADGEVVLIAPDLAVGALWLAHRMLTAGGELVTVLLGDGADAGPGRGAGRRPAPHPPRGRRRSCTAAARPTTRWCWGWSETAIRHGLAAAMIARSASGGQATLASPAGHHDRRRAGAPLPAPLRRARQAHRHRRPGARRARHAGGARSSRPRCGRCATGAARCSRSCITRRPRRPARLHLLQRPQAAAPASSPGRGRCSPARSACSTGKLQLTHPQFEPLRRGRRASARSCPSTRPPPRSPSWKIAQLRAAGARRARRPDRPAAGTLRKARGPGRARAGAAPDPRARRPRPTSTPPATGWSGTRRMGVQLALALRRQATGSRPAPACPPTPGGLLDAFDARLPFTLTAGQRRGRRRDRRRPGRARTR